jgi:hypothetical protein
MQIRIHRLPSGDVFQFDLDERDANYLACRRRLRPIQIFNENSEPMADKDLAANSIGKRCLQL